MRSPYERHVAETTEIERQILRGNASLCRGHFGIAWCALHPTKPAEELAARVGCAVRTAAYEISGEHQPSAQSILALLEDVTPAWK